METPADEAVEVHRDERADMAALKAQLRPTDSGRRFSLRDVGSAELDAATFEGFAETLYDADESRWREQSLAAYTLGTARLTVGQRQAAARALCDLAADRLSTPARRVYDRAERANQRTQKAMQPTAFVLAALAALVGLLGFGSPVGAFWLALFVYVVVFFLGTLCLLPLTVPVLSAQDAQNAARARLFACRALRRLALPQSAGALAQAAAEGNAAVRREARTALLAVLPGLSDAHLGQMEAGTSANFGRALLQFAFADKDVTAALAVLGALEKVGDSQAVEAVRRLIAPDGPAPLQAALLRVLPILEARQQQERDRSVLLRHADAPPAPAAELLRPTDAAPQTPPEQLLRSTNNDATGTHHPLR